MTFMTLHKVRRSKCGRSECQETNFVTFSSNDTSIVKNIFGSGTRKINADACLHFSHLELTVEFTDKDRKRYQEFEGPPTERSRPHNVTLNCHPDRNQGG